MESDSTRMAFLERALADSNARFEALLSLSLDGICILDRVGRIRLANPVFCDLLGRDGRAVVDRSIFEFIPQTLVSFVNGQLENLDPRQAATPLSEFHLVHKDGRMIEIDIEATGMAIQQGGGEVEAMVIVRPTAERKRIESALDNTKQRLQSTFDALAEGVVTQDIHGTIIDCNPAACRILGLEAKELIGRNIQDPRWHAVHEDGGPFSDEGLPGMVALRSDAASRGVVMGVRRGDGVRPFGFR